MWVIKTINASETFLGLQHTVSTLQAEKIGSEDPEGIKERARG